MAANLRLFDSDYVFDDDNGIFIARRLLDRQRLSKLPHRESYNVHFVDGLYDIESIDSLLQLFAALPRKIPDSISRIPTLEEYERLGEWSAANDQHTHYSFYEGFEVVMQPDGRLLLNYQGYEDADFFEIDENHFGAGPFASSAREVVVPISGTFSDVLTRKAEIGNPGVVYLNQGDFGGARAHFEQELAGEPTWLSHFGFAVASYVLAERTPRVPLHALETAIEHQKISVGMNPWYSQSHASLGRMFCHLAIRRFNDANDLRDALRHIEEIEQLICESRTHLLRAIELDEAIWSERVTQQLTHLEKFATFLRRQYDDVARASNWWWRF
jgi:hypothetical protein